MISQEKSGKKMIKRKREKKIGRSLKGAGNSRKKKQDVRKEW